MCYFQTVCCICLVKKRELKEMFRSEGDKDYYTKLTSCIPEMHFKEMDNMKVMCKECCGIVDMMYNYREKCLRSKRILISCISQLGSFDNASSEISGLLTDIANMKQETCSETEYETTIGITDGNVPLPDQASLPNEYEERQMLLAYDNANRCDSEFNNIIKTENIDLHFSDTEFVDTGSDKMPLHDPSSDDELTTKEIKVKIEIEEQPLMELEGDIDVFKSLLKCEKPDNEMNNDDVSVQGTSVGTESSNKESNASEADFLKGLSVKQYECYTCNMKFTRKSILKGHVKKHCVQTGDEQYDKFTRERNLSLECKICNKKFIRKKCLSNHLFTHTDGKPNKCEICAKQFSTKQNLSYHMMAHTGEKPHECNICKTKFITKTRLSTHMMTHTGKKPHKCEICVKQFCSKRDMSIHMMTHTGEKPHKCDICAKSFSTKYKMSLHMRTHTGEKPHKCEICAKSFNVKRNLSLHMITHTDEKPHKCEICAKSFGTKRQMALHMMSHTGEKPHKCEICAKQFSTKQKMSIHMRTHTGEKPYECKKCGKKCTQKEGLARHLFTHAYSKQHECRKCGLMFNKKRHLASHRLTHKSQKSLESN